MAFTSYNFPDMPCKAGTAKITLFADTGLGTLTLPKQKTFVNFDDAVDRLVDKPGVFEVENLSLTIIDDYSTYSEGFWNKVLALPAQLRIYLNEGGSDTYFFWGEVDPTTIDWDVKKFSGQVRRICTFTLISILNVLKVEAIDAWLDDAFSRRATTGLQFDGNIYSAVPMTTFLASAMKVSTNASTFDINDVEFIFGGGTDIQFFSGGVWYDITGTSIPTEVDNGVNPNNDIRRTGIFDNSGGTYPWQGKYKTIWNAILKIAKNLGFSPRIYYDITNSRYRLQMRQLGRGYAGTVTPEKEMAERHNLNDNDLKVNGVIVSPNLYIIRAPSNSATDQIWYHKRYGIEDSENPIPDLEFEIKIDLLFVMESFCRPNGSAFTDMRYWKYTAGSYQTVGSNKKMQRAIAGYYWFRYSGQFRAIRAVYPTLKASDGVTLSHRNLVPLCRTTIDGVTYYAQEVTKNLTTGQATVYWIKE
ncbi:MAG TPA: hypothetical protein VNN76_11530 [Bacteroidota bacterium]|nr:hypothetical protein [Bacteroidota bacterium]